MALRPGKRGPIPRQLAERFWSKVERRGKLDCWLWLGQRDAYGYGRIRTGSLADGTRTMDRAHRVAWILVNGSIPKGMGALHHCDNPPCCNPRHLFIGTNTDNDLDRDRKGRQRNGYSPGGKFYVEKEKETDAAE